MNCRSAIPAVLGVDFGTSSCRVVVIGVNDGALHGTGVGSYVSGQAGVVTRPGIPDLARQNPRDYGPAFIKAACEALSEARDSCVEVLGIGVDTTGSTVLPLDSSGVPLALDDRFADNISAYAWLWKDHTAHREAAALVETLRMMAPDGLQANGGAYSSENIWAKVARCQSENPIVAEAAATWVELCDYVVGSLLSDSVSGSNLPRSIAAASHKGLYTTPTAIERTARAIGTVDQRAGAIFLEAYRKPSQLTDVVAGLSPSIASLIGLPPGIPIATGNLDAHSAALGAGVARETFTKVMGTSGSDMMLSGHSDAAVLPMVEGACGIGRDSIVPGWIGVEFGQPAVGDLLAWGARVLETGGEGIGRLSADAGQFPPLSHGLLALDWFNGNRSTLMNPRLSGVVVGMTLHTSPADIFRALIDATAFSSRRIFDRARKASPMLERVHVTGGIPHRSPLVVQTLADVLGREIWITRSEHGSGIGAAIAAAVAVGAHANVTEAQSHMGHTQDRPITPRSQFIALYDEAYGLWTELHDSMGQDVERKLLERLRLVAEVANS